MTVTMQEVAGQCGEAQVTKSKPALRRRRAHGCQHSDESLRIIKVRATGK